MNQTSRHAFQSATERKNIFITISFLIFVFRSLCQEFYTSNPKPFKIIRSYLQKSLILKQLGWQMTKSEKNDEKILMKYLKYN